MLFLNVVAMTLKILVTVLISVGVNLLPGFKFKKEKRIVIVCASDSFN